MTLHLGGFENGGPFSLPDEIATDSQGILAKKGAGKSNAAVVMAEAMYAAGIAFVAIDPKGDWYGMRSSRSGTEAGLPVVVFGGKHGDFPLEVASGAFVADVILGTDTDRGYLSAVVDVSQFTISEQRRFLTDFGERLYRNKDEEGVLHLFLEEAHEYLPQRVDRDQTKLVSIWQRIVKLGRTKGLGVTVISQRSAALNKDVLTQVDSLFVLRTLSPQDRAAVKAWLDVHVGASEVIATLHELKAGECWLWSPDRLGDPVRFQFAQRATFDSGATPKVGQKRRPPATMADIDEVSIKEQMADTIERARNEDPKHLRKEIARLTRLLDEQKPERVEVPVEVEVRVPYVPDEMVAGVRALSGLLLEIFDRTHADVASAMVTLDGIIASLERDEPPPSVIERPRPAPRAEPSVTKVASAREPTTTTTSVGDVKLERMDWALLGVLVQRPNGLTRDQTALFAGYSPSSGAIDKALARLRRVDWITKGTARIQATPEGIANARDAEPLPSGPDLADALCSESGLPNGFKMERMDRLFLALIIERPGELTRDAVAEEAGYSASSGAVDKALGRLRRIGFVAKGQPLTLTDEFDEAIR